MAEAWLNQGCGEVFEAHSAGLEPGRLNPTVVEAMSEVGIDISHKQPQHVFDVIKSGKAFAYGIAVCDQARGEKCPIFPGVARRLDWSFPDPSQFSGTPDELLGQVRSVRDSIHAKIEDWCAEVCPRESTHGL